MISVDMVVAGGTLVKDIKSGDMVKGYQPGAGFIDLEALILDNQVSHACQLVETIYGAKCVISNNGLIIVNEPGIEGITTRNVQVIGPRSIAVIRQGVLVFEPAKSTPVGLAMVAQLLLSGGIVCAGQAPDALIPVTFPR